MPLVHQSRHPLVLDKVTQLRSVETKPARFRELVRDLAYLLGVEAIDSFEVQPLTVETPLGPANGCRLDQSVAIVPILRAGLGMLEGLLELLPEALVWHLGLYRDETTLQPVEYYNQIPEQAPVQRAIVVDPMLATGGSAVRACQILQASGIQSITLLCLIAAQEGIDHLIEAMDDISIYTAAIDDRLTDIGFIYPGLGDAGDRQFGTS